MQTIKKEKSSEIDKSFLKILQGGESTHVPCWFMRQAGRYLPEYRDLRARKGGFLSMAMDPDAACEITMQPIRRFQMDAAIIFSDILVVPMALGQKLEFLQGEGPNLDPIRDAQGVKSLSDKNFHQILSPVYEAVQKTRDALEEEGFSGTSLIGFAGAPWTVATYMIEGGGSKDFRHAKEMAYGQPELFSVLIDVLVEHTVSYLIKKIEAGAEALQIFDSWAGVLDPEQFVKWSIAPTKRIIQKIKKSHPEIPIIGFPRGAGLNYISYAQETGIDAVGLDSSICTKWAAENLQTKLPVQGNLDPICLLAGGDAVERSTRKILEDLSGRNFIFNLGHGIHKDTPPEHVEKLIKIIRERKS